MFGRIGNYFYERRRGFLTAAGVAGTFYMAGNYVIERLEEIRDQDAQRQKARENLRRRFQQNQEDIMFTIMTHLPTLGNAVLTGMDVESVTRELQTRSRSGRASGRVPSPNPPPSESSLGSSVELVREPEPQSYTDAASASGTDTSVLVGSSGLGDSVMSMQSVSSTQAHSWVEEFNTQMVGSSTEQGPTLAIPSPSSHQRESTLESVQSTPEACMSDSVISVSLPSTSASASEKGHSHTGRSESSDQELLSLSSKTKAELWHEVKMLTFTRTLTIIYSTTLLTLLTTMQLNIIGRSKYVQSIFQLHREEKLREHRSLEASISSILFSALSSADRDLGNCVDEDVQNADLVTPEAELKFLTLSWWLLYVGWKDVGERVRRSVDEVFEGVSLKTRLGPMELHRLLCDVRRRVEHEITYEGTERRINFLSTILPPTPETLALVFGEGGVPGYHSSRNSTPSSSRLPHYLPPTSEPHRLNPESDPTFARLLAELRGTVASPAFAHVLEAALDRATDALLDGLRKSVFGGIDAAADVEVEKPRLANLLPGLARWAHGALDTVPNGLVDSMTELKETKAFAAIIYSSYDG
ncbi:Peroxin-3 [Phellopilus nigrolimitatus]|nr:Peroxin-3 [Phellopilus nigrolimitatus]